MYISGHPLDRCRDLVEGFSTASIQEIQENEESRFNIGSKVKVGGIITHIRNQITKKGDIMRYAELEDLLAAAKKRNQPPFLVIAEGITDPHNLGSIIRTANAAGAHGVVIPKNRSVALNATVSKVSAGAVEYTPVARVTNIPQTLERLKKEGLWIVGTDLSGTQSHYECDLTGPLGVVVGSEGEGMSRLVRESCDFLVRIPMLGEIESLNASVAAGVLLYEAVRQRRQGAK